MSWLNDIERDRQYAKWPASVTELLRHTYPGMLRTVRKNMYHLVRNRPAGEGGGAAAGLGQAEAEDEDEDEARDGAGAG